jgi:SAM-dependent methyltransferase
MIKIITEHEFAVESPDYQSQLLPNLKMSFSAAEDNSTDHYFIDKVAEYISNQRGISLDELSINCLDLGCGGGQLIIDLNSKKFTNVCIGLDGVSGMLNRENWNKTDGILHNTDLSKPFHVTMDDEPLKFDLITSWEVIEHINPSDLVTFFTNVVNHLSDDGIFICSIAMFPDTRDENGYHQDCPEYNPNSNQFVLHQSVFDKEQWMEILKDFNVKEYPLKSEYYKCGYVAPRDHPSHNGKGGSLYLMVTK